MFIKMPVQQYLYKCPNYAVNLNNMRLKTKWCDVTIKVNENEYHAHKLILAANLKYFDTMLSTNSFQESKDCVVTMKHIEGPDLEAFIAYAYTGEILLTDDNAVGLLEVANYLGEDEIRDACIDFLKKHLKKDYACRAYKFADSIDCQSLKNEAKKIIITNFENCSQTIDYLYFNDERLTEILCDGRAQTAELQQKFFEGIMRWIIHDVNNRRNLVEDLLNLIDIGKLKADDLIRYLYEYIVDRDDEYGIMRDVMFYYYTNKIQQVKLQVNTLEQTLMIVRVENHDGRTLDFQFCNLNEKKWSSLKKLSDFQGFVHSTGANLNDKFYFTTVQSPEKYLNVFDPTTRQSTMTLHSSINLSRYSTMCACSKYLYLCGGRMYDRSDQSAQVLRYDPSTNFFETLPQMRVKRWGAAAIFYQGSLLVLGGWNSNFLNSIEKYDIDTKQWSFFSSMRESRDWPAVVILDEKLYACGGWIRNSVEVYDPSKNSWELVASMNKQRKGFIVIVHNGKLLAIGGDLEKTVEVYEPLENVWQMDDELSSGLDIENLQGGLIHLSVQENVE